MTIFGSGIGRKIVTLLLEDRTRRAVFHACLVHTVRDRDGQADESP